MNMRAKISVVVALLTVIAVTLAFKQRAGATRRPDGVSPSCPHCLGKEGASRPTTSAASPLELPRLVDLGADKCIPCKRMAPILEELKKTFAGRLDVEFIDVWKNPNVGDLYNYRMIPTQIFFDASGEERFRHEGFFSREDILGKWKELGVDLSGQPAPAKASEAK